MKPLIMTITLLLAAFCAGYFWEAEGGELEDCYRLQEQGYAIYCGELIEPETKLKECQEALSSCQAQLDSCMPNMTEPVEE